MKLAASGELSERPFAALRGTGGCASGRGRGDCTFGTPICRRGMDTPNVARFVESDSDHPPLAAGAERHTVGDECRYALAAGQIVQRDGVSRFQLAREADAAALRIQHQCVPGFRKWDCGIQAGHAKWNLGANTGAAPSRFGYFFRGVHNESFPDSTFAWRLWSR